MKILVKANNWLGDAVMSLPTLRSLRQMLPDAGITVLTREVFADLYLAAPCVDEILPYADHKRSAVALSAIRLARSLRKRSFNTALVLPRSFYAAVLPFAAGIPRRIGYRSEGRSLLLTDAFPRRRWLLRRHRVHYFHHLLNAFGRPPLPQPPRLEIPGDALDRMSERLPKGRPLVALNPGATYGGAKQWFPERFAEVARRLAREHGAKIVAVGSPAEADLASRVLSDAGGGVNLAGKTTVLELAAALKACDLLLTNDTGPMHVADAAGTPVVAVFGPTDPVTTPPYGRRRTLVRCEIECSPCLRRECPSGTRECMKRVTTDEVYLACQKWLQ